MSAARPAEVLRRLEHSNGAPGTDAELLARFVATKDADAFAELVRRHGPCVLGACRRVTGQAQDAEDAFQATFLVLAKKAAGLRSPELLGNYLYGVAFRVAARAKRSAARRRAREVTVPTLPDPPAPAPPPVQAELAPILDEELAQLPACYREAIVLCDLRGASRETAAAALGVPEGTLSSRLAAGRKKLAARLTRRGVSLSVGALPVALGEARAQVVSNELIAKTCGLVADWSAGGAVPAPLARLTTGDFPVRKLLVLGATMVLGVAGAVFAAQPRDDAPPSDLPKPVADAKGGANPQPKEGPKADDKAAPFTSAPRKLRAFDLGINRVSQMRWNATGTHLAVIGRESAGGAPVAGKPRSVVWVFTGANDSKQGFNPIEGASLVAVAPDGREVITDLREYQLISGDHQLKWWGDRGERGVLGELKRVDLDLPETHGYAFAADGKTFRTVAYHRDASSEPAKLEALEVDAKAGKSAKSLITLDFGYNAMSANGKRLAVVDKDNKRVTVYDLDRGAKVSSAELAEPSSDLFKVEAPALTFSPDGRRLAVSRGISFVQILNADTGESLPALEGTKQAQVYSDANAFTGDGRLFAAAVVPYKVTTRPNKGFGNPPQTSINAESGNLTVWDTQTGKALKTWRSSNARPAFNPARPLLAILEDNEVGGTRVGFWDFAAEVEKK